MVEVSRKRAIPVASARARGRVGGRRPRLTEDQAALAQELYDARVKTVQQIADLFGVPLDGVRAPEPGHGASAAEEDSRKGVDADGAQPCAAQPCAAGRALGPRVPGARAGGPSSDTVWWTVLAACLVAIVFRPAVEVCTGGCAGFRDPGYDDSGQPLLREFAGSAASPNHTPVFALRTVRNTPT